MSDAESQGQPQDRIGHLLKRMTLANLGLDDLEGIDEGSRAAMAGVDDFAARIDANAQRMESEVGLSVLAGTPGFLQGVQERYVPMHVDTEFGLDVDTSGPRNPGDVGPWQKLIDGVHLILFDEDEEGDFVSFDPSIRKQQVRQAIAKMAKERRAPASVPALKPVRKQLQLADLPEQERTERPAASDFLTISESARRSLFGPSTRTASTSGSLFSRRQRAAAANARAMSLDVDGAEAMDTGLELVAESLPGLATMSTARFGSAIARRHGAAGETVRRASMLSGPGEMLKSLRGVQLADERSVAAQIQGRRSSDPRMGGTASSLGQAVSQSREGYQYLGAAPGSLLALVPDSLESEAIAALHGASARGEAPMRAVESNAADDASFVSAYPSSMGRAGMLDVRAYMPGTPMTRLAAELSGASQPSVSTRARRESAQRASTQPGSIREATSSQVRHRLTGYSALSGRSGQLLQTLADEPVARLAAVARRRMQDLAMSGRAGASAPGRLTQVDRGELASAKTGPADRMLERTPMSPSTLGFAIRDLVAPLGLEEVASAAGRLTDVRELYLSSPTTEFVRGVDDEDTRLSSDESMVKRQALVRRALAAEQPVTAAERASLTSGFESRSAGMLNLTSAETPAWQVRAQATPERPSAAATLAEATRPSAGRSLYGDVSLDRRFLPTLTGGLDVARRASSMKLIRSSIEEQSTSEEESTYSRLDRMLGLVGVGERDTAELRGALDVLKRVGAVPRESKLAWQGDRPVLITPRGDILDARSALDSATSPAQLEMLAQTGEAISPSRIAPRQINVRGESGPRLDRFGDMSRMLGSRRALTMLAGDVLETADPISVDMLRESVLGEVARISSRRAEDAREEGSVTGASDSVLNRLGLGERGELRLPTGIDSTAEVVRMALSAQRGEARSGLALRSGIGRAHQLASRDTTSSLASVGSEASRRMALGKSAAGILARLDIEAGRAEVGAQPFEPGVLGLAQHEERVDAEVASYVEGFTGLLGDVTEMRPIQVTSEEGESLRLSLSPRALSRVLAGRGGMADAPSGGAVPVQELRTTLRDVLRQRGATPNSVAQALQDRISGLSLDIGDVADDRSTVTQVAETTRAIERAAGRFASARASVERRPGFFETLAPGAFDSAAPSYELASAFDSPLQTLVEQRARQVLGSRIKGLATQRAEQVASEMGLTIGARDMDPDTLAIDVEGTGTPGDLSTSGTRVGRQLDVTVESTLPGAVSGYEMVQPASLSRVLKRFAPERSSVMRTAQVEQVQEIVDSSLAETVAARAVRPAATSPSRFDSLRGEPGQLSDTLEHFVPASSSPRPVGRGGESMLAGEHVLPSSVSRAPGSLSHRIELLEMESTEGLLGDVRREVLDRMSRRGEPTSYVEPTGMSEDAVRELFDLGSGEPARQQGRRHELARMLDRLDGLLDDAQSLSERQGRVGAPGVLAELKGMDSGMSLESGLPSWRRKDEQIQGIDANELKDLLRQVGATPVQGSKAAIDRQLVNPYVGQPGADGADPLFSGGAAAAEAKPSNQVQDQEAAFSAADVGLPPYEELMFIAEEAYRVIVNKLHEELKKRSE